MAKTVLETVESELLTAIAQAIGANATFIESQITSGEADIQAALVNLFKNIPIVKGIAGIFEGPVLAAIEAAIEGYAASLVAKYTPAQLVQMIQAYLLQLAARV